MSRQLILAYLAGLFDGEGSISIVKRQNEGRWNGIAFRINITVAMCDSVGPVKFMEMFGGKQVYCEKWDKNPKHRSVYIWTISARKAHRMLCELLPYLHVKRLQAELAIQLQKRISKTVKPNWITQNGKKVRGKRWGPGEYDVRNQMFFRLRELKREPVHGGPFAISAKSGDPAMGIPNQAEDINPQACVETMSRAQSLNSERDDIVQANRNQTIGIPALLTQPALLLRQEQQAG